MVRTYVHSRIHIILSWGTTSELHLSGHICAVFLVSESLSALQAWGCWSWGLLYFSAFACQDTCFGSRATRAVYAAAPPRQSMPNFNTAFRLISRHVHRMEGHHPCVYDYLLSYPPSPSSNPTQTIGHWTSPLTQ